MFEHNCDSLCCVRWSHVDIQKHVAWSVKVVCSEGVCLLSHLEKFSHKSDSRTCASLCPPGLEVPFVPHLVWVWVTKVTKRGGGENLCISCDFHLHRMDARAFLCMHKMHKMNEIHRSSSGWDGDLVPQRENSVRDYSRPAHSTGPLSPLWHPRFQCPNWLSFCPPSSL